ncbi:hypothetical protein ANCCAN_21636 [Ancylostoma caninum]|uniref:Uncharacterized protein n=1 Tax=Ancylostoma caninum TaxID=29170 RepID=A0A368FP27_ANCCA|nr:hypothetical protein ANCCAN_21636 [Ancylostoma caninum]
MADVEMEQPKVEPKEEVAEQNGNTNKENKTASASVEREVLRRWTNMIKSKAERQIWEEFLRNTCHSKCWYPVLKSILLRRCKYTKQ